MNDLRVITILPPQPVSGAQQSQMANSQAQWVDIVNFPVGSVLSGFIINRDVSGNPILRTSSGDITFASNFFLNIGSEITIRIEHIAGNTAAHILSVNGKAPEIAATESAFAGEPEIILGGHLQPQNNSTASSGQTSQQGATNTQATHNFPALQPADAASAKLVANTGNIDTSGITIGKLVSQPTPANNALQSATNFPVGTQFVLLVASVEEPVGTPTYAPTAFVQAVSSQQATQTANTNSHFTTTTRAQPEPAPATPPTFPASSQISAYEKVSAATPSFTANIPATPTFADANISARLQNIGQPTVNVPNMQIPATVIGKAENGEVLAQTPLGIIRFTPTPTPESPVEKFAALGSKITFELVQVISENQQQPQDFPASQNVSTIRPTPITQMARGGGAISDIFSILAGFSSADADEFTSKFPSFSTARDISGQHPNITARADNLQNLPVSLMVFASSLRSMNFREWLGAGNIKLLEENGHESLVKKAKGEFMALARQFVEVAQGSWQSLFFPIAVDGQLQPVRWFTKRERNKGNNGENANDSEDTRFVVEMELSNLGQMQLDGFVRRVTPSPQNTGGNVRFDLIIRSHSPIPKDMQGDILQIYNNIGELTGFSGSISFQAVREFPVNPMEELASGEHQRLDA